jgi:hypothetical protein
METCGLVTHIACAWCETGAIMEFQKVQLCKGFAHVIIALSPDYALHNRFH